MAAWKALKDMTWDDDELEVIREAFELDTKDEALEKAKFIHTQRILAECTDKCRTATVNNNYMIKDRAIKLASKKLGGERVFFNCIHMRAFINHG